MAATKTVSQRLRLRKFTAPEILAANPKSAITPRHGVVTLYGYGIQVRVDSGHLILEDGIGADRRYARFPRVAHGLERLVIIGHDGMVSLAALRWLADQNAAFVMLERDGKILTVAGPARKSEVHLRRAQALARQSGIGIQITRELISKKLVGQEQIARSHLRNSVAADTIARLRSEIPSMSAFDSIRLLESQAGAAYWGAWGDVQIQFPQRDLPRVPDHWRTFSARRSPISGSPRLASNPCNSMLNYLYTILETEARLATATLGLDPCLGFMHADATHRDSLPADLMEPVRPQVDAFVLNWLASEPLKRKWFFEQRDGNCRLMAPFAARLSETAQTWRRAIAPLAEYVARALCSKGPKHARYRSTPTRLTQEQKRIVKGGSFENASIRPISPDGVCRICGTATLRKAEHCKSCGTMVSTEHMRVAAAKGRSVAHSSVAQSRRAATQRKNVAAAKNWDVASLPTWLNEDFYRVKIVPLLATVTRSSIASLLGVSLPYAANVRNGKRIPHPRHWVKLAKLAGVSPES
jgi:CRISPR-associated endonuclease Cas1